MENIKDCVSRILMDLCTDCVFRHTTFSACIYICENTCTCVRACVNTVSDQKARTLQGHIHLQAHQCALIKLESHDARFLCLLSCSLTNALYVARFAV